MKNNNWIFLILSLSIGVLGYQFDDNGSGYDKYDNNNTNNDSGNSGNVNRYNDRYTDRYTDNNNGQYYNHHHHKHHHHHHKCQSERFEHQVIMKTYKDSTGHWVLYTQIIETRNIGNICNRNEYIYLAHRQKSGWFWNPKKSTLVQYSLGEPKFISRRVRNPNRPNHAVIVNMSGNYTTQSIDLDRAFPARLAGEVAALHSDDLKWSELARRSMPILQNDTAYFETVMPHENSGKQRIKVLSDSHYNRRILE